MPDTDYNPYAIGCYKGCPTSDFFSDDDLFSSCTEDSDGYTDDYTPTALIGLYEEYGAYTGADNPDGAGAVVCSSDDGGDDNSGSNDDNSGSNDDDDSSSNDNSGDDDGDSGERRVSGFFPSNACD